MNDKEQAKIILEEMQKYLMFDNMQCEYAEKGIMNALRRIRKEKAERGNEE